MKKYYVGLKYPLRDVFVSPNTPTYETHGHRYNAVIGPFQTKRGAVFMAKYGENNPHCRTVRDAERLAKAEGGAE